MLNLLLGNIQKKKKVNLRRKIDSREEEKDARSKF
jgi:hypothetical protein